MKPSMTSVLRPMQPLMYRYFVLLDGGDFEVVIERDFAP